MFGLIWVFETNRIYSIYNSIFLSVFSCSATRTIRFREWHWSVFSHTKTPASYHISKKTTVVILWDGDQGNKCTVVTVLLKQLLSSLPNSVNGIIVSFFDKLQLSSPALCDYRWRNVNSPFSAVSAWHYTLHYLLASYPFTAVLSPCRLMCVSGQSFTLQMTACVALCSASGYHTDLVSGRCLFFNIACIRCITLIFFYN